MSERRSSKHLTVDVDPWEWETAELSRSNPRRRWRQWTRHRVSTTSLNLKRNGSERRCSYSLDFAMEKCTCLEICDWSDLPRQAHNWGIQKNHISSEKKNPQSASNTRIASARYWIYRGDDCTSDAGKECFSSRVLLKSNGRLRLLVTVHEEEWSKLRQSYKKRHSSGFS